MAGRYMGHAVSREALVCALTHHVGAEHGATARRLVAEITGASWRDPAAERLLRLMVQTLRMEGTHICAHPSRGYYMARDAAEMEETLDFLRRRALTSLAQLSAMTHTSIPDLVGQMRFTQ